MGYETSFRLKGELDQQFKSFCASAINKSDVEMYKSLLRARCMAAGDVPPEDWPKLYKDLKFLYGMYTRMLEEDWKKCMESRTTGEDYEKCGIWFCGWNHARGSYAHTWESMEEIENYFFSNIFAIAVCPAGSMFDHDNDKYWTKTEKLSEYINDLPDAIDEYWDSAFIKFYREHPELATETGDDTPEPEFELETEEEVADDNESTTSVETCE